ncbi:PP2C family protein-serine/threonine phosphatase [Streptomyces sp. NBC_00083]|uniref:PP2C family protein-serine/threonine phosphatase n=1 Tax=Streptomyces sp. NBC_00083 TaxID=2975647 RepID=UPI00224CF843|nr:SpoIIE family protein phosphatase [Streptomyces sp. NBC_00083]MCX5387362.1 SpoIIE family protein phosphatase [Streptomyces sp. NBC_00083]
MKTPAARRRSPLPVLVTALRTEHDVFALRRHVKTLTEAVGLDPRDQVRLATAVSELGRDLLRPAVMTAVFDVQQEPAALRTVLQWNDDRAPSPESLTAVTRLLPQTRYEPAPAGTPTRAGRIEIVFAIPELAARDLDLEQLRGLLESASPTSAIDDLRAQTRDLIASLQEAHAQRDELERLNEELTETNAGVMAMYAELTVEHKDVVERYSQEHELALTLQRTFLPTTLPQVDGAELSVRYLPAATTAEIGGDFYEAVSTPRGLLLAVGDVVGHSLQAAMVMGALRHALRAYAAQDHPPHVLLEHLDHLLRLHQPGWTATVCIALIEPGNTRLHIANAGHLPPLLLTGDTAPRYLTPHGPLLGIGLPQPVATEYAVEAGSRLLMITDGLIETRDDPLDERLDLLAATAVAGPEDPDALCTKLLDTFGTEPDDDIITFAARLTPPPPT